MAATQQLDHIDVDLGHGARGLFTTRHAGNLGLWTADDPDAVAENRRRVLALTGGDGFAYGRQVHGTTVTVADAPTTDAADADGQVVFASRLPALVLTADCLAILLATPDAVAAVHAGWRGLADGVVEAALAKLGDGPISAVIGPAACRRCYEVGDEVREAFGHAPLGHPAPIDLKAIAREKLEAAGAHVADVGLCTMHDEGFFSHRAQGPKTGRQAGVVWRG